MVNGTTARAAVDTQRGMPETHNHHKERLCCLMSQPVPLAGREPAANALYLSAKATLCGHHRWVCRKPWRGSATTSICTTGMVDGKTRARSGTRSKCGSAYLDYGMAIMWYGMHYALCVELAEVKSSTIRAMLQWQTLCLDKERTLLLLATAGLRPA